ncbi:hypothetical protein [Desulfoscipio geothermicus]|uniref:Uncharacterized protein n=1 Tax=Desulfoscipio geothermicus DSM 3669 TaxID=1121426 RepID=A0A1I6DWG3_9FIRM|nr:hypothetical protein [Desulfoscipio geothermicus]SFR09793.1 hypothetical protein SAMN05660706_11961 [Desulfoscipio geothermicus DSM 3669]
MDVNEKNEKNEGKLDSKLQKMKESGAEAWKELKVGMEEARNDLSKAMDKAANRFRQ